MLLGVQYQLTERITCFIRTWHLLLTVAAIQKVAHEVITAKVLMYYTILNLIVHTEAGQTASQRLPVSVRQGVLLGEAWEQLRWWGVSRALCSSVWLDSGWSERCCSSLLESVREPEPAAS